jgi:diguanylate cyclase (GGDEF)-like protein
MAPAAVVLVADEQEWSLRALENVLASQSYAVLRAGSGREALSLAYGAYPDALILDDGLTDLQATEVCRQLRANPLFRMVPMILTTDESADRARRAGALAAGAWACLTRPLDSEMLLRQLQTFVSAKRSADELRERGLVDELTGLYNRRGFLTLARQQIKMAERMRRGLVHIFFDLDGMKQINDTYGHREGDLALIESAEILRTTFRQSDVLARIGGDEFAVLALETSEVRADLLFARLQDTLNERNARGHRPYALSFSMGITSYEPGRSSSVEELLAQADRMMYQQKRRRGLTPRDLQKI